MFIILGIVIVFVVVLLFYFFTVEEARVKTFPEELRQKMHLGLQSCMKQSLKEGVRVVSKNLGALDTIEYKGEEIPLLVRLDEEFKERFNNIIISTKPPEYPWTTFPFVEGEIFLTGSTLFGMNELKSYDEIKENLKRKVQELFEKCVKNLDNEKVIQDNPVIKLNFDNNDIIGTVKNVRLKNDGVETIISNLITKTSTDLEKLHSFVNYIINNEITSLKYTPESSENFIVSVERDNFKNSIIKVSHRNEDLSFKFAIPNRYPALEFINTSKFFNNTHLLCPESRISFEENKIIISAGKPPTTPCHPGEEALCFEVNGVMVRELYKCVDQVINLKAYDPDDDILTFSVKPRLPNIKLPYIITMQDSEKSSFDLIVGVSDGSKVDFQKLKLCFKRGKAC